MRREAAYAAMTVAEHFRDQGKSVLLLMDSVTRFCLALAGDRAVGWGAAGDPRPPPERLRRTARVCWNAPVQAPSIDGRAGQITALFTVLVEG